MIGAEKLFNQRIQCFSALHNDPAPSQELNLFIIEPPYEDPAEHRKGQYH